MVKRIACCALSILLGLAIPCRAQEALRTPTEGRLWIGAAWELRLNKDWNLDLEQQLRLDREARTFQQTFSEVKLEYEIGKRAGVFQEYRFSIRDRGYSQRLGTGISWQVLDAKPWYLSVQGKYQHDFSPFDLDEGNWRSKARVRYRVNKRWSLYGSAENWSELYPYRSAFSRLRTGGGFSFDRKRHEMRIQYFYERNWSPVVFDPGQRHILSLGYARLR